MPLPVGGLAAAGSEGGSGEGSPGPAPETPRRSATVFDVLTGGPQTQAAPFLQPQNDGGRDVSAPHVGSVAHLAEQRTGVWGGDVPDGSADHSTTPTTPDTPDTPTATATATVHHRVDDSGPADTLLPRGGGAFLRPPQLEGDGALSRARQWADYREERDTVYHRRLAAEERFERATGDLSEDIADGARRFEGLFGGDGRQGGPVRAYAEESYRAQLRDAFEELSRRAGPAGVTAEQWRAAHDAAREGMTRFFRQGAERERHEEMFRGDFDRALADFRGGDLF
ncbi:hypothetical protein ACIBBE_49520, partial [Streptomyces sp. NPDC051644]|uniref:hypothetical protein n=1 Tax=Streptomyces sp. NPDC051644 TaxID=3365666 RepID=UPI00379C4C39